MRYNSFAFLVFAAVFFATWPLVRGRDRSRWVALTLFSFFFYGWWDWRFTTLLAASGLIDYWAALAIEKWRDRRRPLLALSLGCNLTILGVFKYAGFAAESFNTLFEALGGNALLPVLRMLPPAGLSFYTFQAMSYTIDVYRGRLAATRDIFHFFSYLTLFPQLVAGPIVRAADLLPQLTWGRAVTAEQRWDGLRLMAQGFFKKMVIADNLAPAVNHAFSAFDVTPSAPYWWLVVSMTAFQVYGDFSGYSDIAAGLCKWMGYEILPNFDRPYTAASMREFWTRWHISLTSWFRDYVYFPLGGSRGSEAMTHRNSWLTMLLVGIWHGASWNFVAFGVLHATFLSVERVARIPERLCKLPLGRPAAVLLTLAQVWLGYVLFRAVSFDQATRIILTLFSPGGMDQAGLGLLRPAFPFLALGVLWELIAALEPHKWSVTATSGWRQAQIVFTAVLIFCCVYLRGPGSAFVYFQF